jgi:carboxyvinyl-carboxyphosphonate phosphorylmutase
VAKARATAFLAAGADGICLTGVGDADLVGAVHAATALPIFLITYSGGNFGGMHALAMAGVRIWLDGHTPYLASVQATYASLKKLRAGMHDHVVHGVAPAELMAQVTRCDEYRRLSRDYLETPD